MELAIRRALSGYGRNGGRGGLKTAYDLGQLCDRRVGIILELSEGALVVVRDDLRQVAARQCGEHVSDLAEALVTHFHETVQLRDHLAEIVLVTLGVTTSSKIAPRRGLDQPRNLAADRTQAVLHAMDGCRNLCLLAG